MQRSCAHDIMEMTVFVHLCFIFVASVKNLVYCCDDNVRVLDSLQLRSSEIISNYWSGGNDHILNDAGILAGWYSATLYGWQYLMTDVTNKPDYLKCSTYWPIYLKEGHIPEEDIGEDPKDIIACMRDDIYPCSTKYTIQVRKCNGEIQYKLIPTTVWLSAYCFEKHKFLNTSTPSPAPQNVDFGKITVQPKLEFKHIQNEILPNLQFWCDFNNITDLHYSVTWFIDETPLNETFGPSQDTRDLVLDEGHLTSRGISLGINIRCGVSASIGEDGIPTPMNRSVNFYAGMKVVNTSVFIDKQSSAMVQMVSTVPIGCQYLNGANQMMLEKLCVLEMKLIVHNDAFECKDMKGSLLNQVSQTNGEQNCAQQIKTLAEGDRWNPDDVFNFPIVTSDHNYEDGDKFILKLQFGETRGDPIWKNYIFPDVNVFVQNTNAYKSRVCRSRNDPHMKTADGYSYENHVEGTYMLYINEKYNIEVQQIIKQCDYGWEIAKCTCAVAVTAGQDVFMINRCGSTPLFAFTQCGDGGILDVKKINDLSYKIFTPIGTRISISLFSWNIWMNVEITMAPKDMGNVYGLCGRVDGDKSNDLKHRNSSVTSSLGTATYNYHPEFSESWRIEENAEENLFRPTLRSLSPWVRQNGLFCVCNSTSADDVKKALCSSTQYLDCVQPDSITKTKCHVKDRRKRRVGNQSSKEMQRILSKIAAQSKRRIKREDVQDIVITEEAQSICRNKISGMQALTDFTEVGANDDEQTVIQQCEFDLSVVKDTSWADVHVEAVNDGVKNMLDLQPTIVENNSEKVETFYVNTCPMNCSNRGECVKSGVCSCFTFFKGPDCSIDERDGLTIFDIEGDGECDLADEEECECFYLRSENIQENFTCSVNTSKILKNGAVEFVSASTLTGGFEDIFTGICCAPESIIGIIDVFVAQYSVSISNNGVNFGNVENVYVYNSMCQDISKSDSGSKSFSLKDKHCFVDGYCYADGDIAQAGCRSCQSTKSLYDWTEYNPCKNGGNCNEEAIGYSCTCMPGYRGINCELEIDECSSSPCQNGGICTDLLNAYSCKCLDGFAGNNCQTDIDECSSNPCKHGALCIDEINMYQCKCTDGYEGTNCELNINECKSDPCRNGGTCKDLVANFTCVCVGGYEGITCSNEINECISNPCKNGGTCNDVVNGFQCTCFDGFTGKTCENEECTAGPCQNEGSCVMVDNVHTCLCAAGYDGKNCENDINECQSSPCQNGGTCNDLVNSFECACVLGYDGAFCDKEIEECLSAPCQNGGVCTDLMNMYSCQCLDGFSGRNCETETNECVSNPCENGGRCTNLANGFECTCENGYTGRICETEINECQSSPCQNGGTCNDLVNSFECTCVLGYNGALCDKEIDECLSAPCQNGGVCTDLMNMYSCQCLDGFSGRNCETDINECASDPCKNGGTCKDLIANFECECVNGYEGKTCSNGINECVPNPCENGGTCTNVANGFECTCESGYTGRICETEIDECSSEPCKNGGVCIDLLNKYTCKCPKGFYGINCEIDVQECQSSPCQNGGTCNDLVNSFECACALGYNGALCDKEIDECLSAPCQNGGVCTDLMNMYSCQCLDGFSGRNCETEIVLLCSSTPCKNGGVCTDLLNEYTCKCPKGFYGRNCETDINECSSDPCSNGAHCVDDVNSYHCNCADGYEGTNCEQNINECESNPCENGGMCIDLVADFKCKCVNGYGGKTCRNEIKHCLSNPCKNEGTCYDVFGGYQCTCSVGYTGSNCEFDINKCDSYPCKNGGSCKDKVKDFHCICADGYAGKTCETGVQSTTESVVIDIARTTFIMLFQVNSVVNFTNPRFKEDVKAQLVQVYKSTIGNRFKDINILDLRMGSLIIEFEVSYVNDPAAIFGLIDANLDLVRGEKTIELFNESIKATTLTVHNFTVSNASIESEDNVCAFFTTLHGECDGSQSCVVSEGKPSCLSQSGDGDVSDDVTMVIVVAVCSVIAFLIIVVASACIVFHVILKRKKIRKTKGKFSVRYEEKRQINNLKQTGFYESSFINGSFKSTSDFQEYMNVSMQSEQTD